MLFVKEENLFFFTTWEVVQIFSYNILFNFGKFLHYKLLASQYR